MAELLQSGQSTDGAGRAAATSLNALLKKSKKPTVRGRPGVGRVWEEEDPGRWRRALAG